VLGLDANGALGPIDVSGLRTNPAHATGTVTFSGNLASGATTYTIGTITVMDAAGTSYTLSARLDAVANTPNTWTVTVLQGTTTVGTGTISFTGGVPDPTASRVSVTFSPAGQAPVPLTLDFSQNVTSTGTASSTSTLAMASQDGYGFGGLTKTTFDANGVLVLSYSNGQTVRSSRLALGRFTSADAVTAVGDNEFEAKDPQAWQAGVAGEQGFATVRSGMVESSNVDLSQQFSELVIMQRGYQACSQVVSTANEMLTELFGMRKG
jgi:flagellar hook protein FlgE